MASRDTKDLTLSMRSKYARFQAAMFEAGIPYIVTCTARTYLEQIALYSQGREPAAAVNAKRKEAGLAPLNATEASRVVTWTLHSRHITTADKPLAEAFDIALLDRQGKATWDIKADIDADRIPDYEEAGRIGEACGLTWGGRWKSPDYPHFQEA